MIVPAYAKINLTLDVTGRREDGYHTLDSIMQTVSLCDTVELSLQKEPGIFLRTDRAYLPANEKNTAYRAAKLFFEAVGLPSAGLRIRLRKNIPSRAGLGGGSADAAAVLRGLNSLYAAGLSVKELMALGEKIGADVPFCVFGGAARCTGIGENVEPVRPLPDCWVVLCRPPAGVSTPRAYALLDRLPPARTRATPKMLAALETGDLRQIGRRLSNRFQGAMHLMQVQQIEKAMLSAGAAGAMMSGSGSAVYGLFQREDAARCCLSLLEDRGESFLCRPHNLQQSP